MQCLVSVLLEAKTEERIQILEQWMEVMHIRVSLQNSRRYAGLPSKESSVLREHQLLIPISFRVQIVLPQEFSYGYGNGTYSVIGYYYGNSRGFTRE